MPDSLHSAMIARKHVVGDVAFLDLVPQAGQFPGFTAGAHIDLHLPGGLTRQYSLWNAPAEPNVFRIAVRLEPRGQGGSLAAHALPQGAVVKISAPRNHFALLAAGMTILIGAGIGITPLLSMAAALHQGGKDYVLHYIDRGERAAFRGVLAQHHSPPLAGFMTRRTAVPSLPLCWPAAAPMPGSICADRLDSWRICARLPKTCRRRRLAFIRRILSPRR